MKTERSPRRLLNALIPHVRDGLAAGYLPPSAIGSASSSEKPIHLSARLELVVFSAS
jgi:hypothetical protein